MVIATDSTITGSGAVFIIPASADHFRVYAPASVTAGQTFDVIVVALDPFGNRDTNCTGTLWRGGVTSVVLRHHSPCPRTTSKFRIGRARAGHKEERPLFSRKVH